MLRRNIFSGNKSDGIQLIDYPGKSPRSFRIERNLFFGNGEADLGCMEDGNTRENGKGAPLAEQVLVLHNTFAGGKLAITGGDNMLLLNNLITGYTTAALTRVHGDSAAGPNLLWNNAADDVECDLDTTAFIVADPKLTAEHRLTATSPALDAAVATFDFHGDEITPEPLPITGKAPDLGAFEFTGK